MEATYSRRLVLLLLLLGARAERPWARARCGPSDLVSVFGGAIGSTVALEDVLPEYPRPTLVRGDPTPRAPGALFSTLHGVWQFEHLTNGSSAPDNPPFGRDLNSSILVPFPPESCLSGVGYLGPEGGPAAFPDFRTLWYRLLFDDPLAARRGDNVATVLRFEAVDYNTTVFLNGILLGSHAGGYSSFSFDVTSHLLAQANELIVHVFDPTEEGPQPQGKQLIQSEAKCGTLGEKYVPVSGIWGAVWLEAAPERRVSALRMRTNQTAVLLRLNMTAGFGVGATLNLTASLEGVHVASYTAPMSTAEVTELVFVIPGAKAWSAERPTLYTLSIVASSADGSWTDTVRSYFALRSVGLEHYMRPATAASGPLNNTDVGGVAVMATFDVDSADQCANACAGNASAGCTGWAFAVPDCGPNGVQGVCRLKSQIGGPPLVPFSQCSIAGRAEVPAAPAARPTINGEPTFFAAWLDQSYWPDGGFTAPTDAALRSDLEAAKALGLNAIRLHTTVRSERWYYAADMLGINVLQDFVQKFNRENYPTVPETVPLFLADAAALIDQRGSHPSVVQWNLFNEGDCVSQFDVAAVLNASKVLDASALGHGRLFNVNSGGPANALGLGDVNDVHTYPFPGSPVPTATQFSMVGEWGGLGWWPAGGGAVWQNGGCYAPGIALASAQLLADSLVAFTADIELTGLQSASVVTQATDVECECDGLLNYDRTAKFSDAQRDAIAAANQRLIASGSGAAARRRERALGPSGR
jgi:hypothetical protein